MARLLLAALASTLAITASPLALARGVEPAAPATTIAVSGAGVAMFPQFDPSIERYAITTTEATGGVVDVHATADGPIVGVWVNGRPATADTTVRGLASGDEISVILGDGSQSTAYSLIYLPAGFPTLHTTRFAGSLAEGLVWVTPNQWNASSPRFEAVVDEHGVPVHVLEGRGRVDLKPQPNGSYSVAAPTTDPGRTGVDVVELDGQFREIARHRTVGLVDTDSHDSILTAEGTRLLLAYEPNPATGRIDAVIQELDRTGSVLFEWRSNTPVDLSAETMVDPAQGDYAHINSVFLMADGDILASFRNLSVVLKIARTAHDGFQPGDIVWRLGGRHSDFEFVDDEYPGGPCAQHTASELPNGNILIYDNGSGFLGENLCVDPADPQGVGVPRPLTRVTEYQLGDVDTDTATKATARLVWEYRQDNRFSFFAGSAQRLDNGNTMVGWAPLRQAMATEVGPDGNPVWELSMVRSADEPHYGTYRALKYAAPDRIPPALLVRSPADGARFRLHDAVTADVTCTDRGGSTLQGCTGVGGPPATVDTSTTGRHRFVGVAVDGAGNTTRVVRRYTVLAEFQPDVAARLGSGRWLGDRVYGGTGGQLLDRVVHSARPGTRTVLRLRNDGTGAQRLRVAGGTGNRSFKVRYQVGGVDVTGAVLAGRYRTRRLGPGEAQRMTLRVVMRAAAAPGDVRTFRLRARSPRDGSHDAVAVRVRVRG